MYIEAEKKLFTVDDLDRMCEAGIFQEEDRFELVDGEIIMRRPPSPRHVACTNRANTLFTEAFGRRAIVSVQNPLFLNKYNLPVPDVAVLRPQSDFYESKSVASQDTLLVVEVALTTLSFDRRIKLPRYAEAAVPEFWIEDLKHSLLLVYREPSGETYNAAFTLGRGDLISPLAFPDATFKVEDLIG